MFVTPRLSMDADPLYPAPHAYILDDQLVSGLCMAVGSTAAVELVGTFFDDAPLQICALERADSAQALVQAANRLRGASLMLGLLELQALCMHLEKAGKEGRFPASAADTGTVRSALRRALLAWKAALDRNG